MAISGKVRGGTTPSESLCHTCSHAHIYQGEDSRENIYCHIHYYDQTLLIQEKVVRCNKYDNSREMHPPLDILTDMAFILTEQGPLKTIGFVPSREWRKKNFEEEVVPDRKIPRFR